MFLRDWVPVAVRSPVGPDGGRSSSDASSMILVLPAFCMISARSNIPAGGVMEGLPTMPKNPTTRESVAVGETPGAVTKFEAVPLVRPLDDSTGETPAAPW